MRIYRRRKDGRLIIGALASAICAPFMYLALMRPSGDVTMFAILMGTGIGVMYAYYSTVYATIQDIVEPALRGTAMSMYFCAMYLAGASLGPIGTGFISDYFTAQAATSAGVVEHTTAALEPFRGGGPPRRDVRDPRARRASRTRAVCRVADRAKGHRGASQPGPRSNALRHRFNVASPQMERR